MEIQIWSQQILLAYWSLWLDTTQETGC